MVQHWLGSEAEATDCSEKTYLHKSVCITSQCLLIWNKFSTNNWSYKEILPSQNHQLFFSITGIHVGILNTINTFHLTLYKNNLGFPFKLETLQSKEAKCL